MDSFRILRTHHVHLHYQRSTHTCYHVHVTFTDFSMFRTLTTISLYIDEVTLSVIDFFTFYRHFEIRLGPQNSYMLQSTFAFTNFTIYFTYNSSQFNLHRSLKVYLLTWPINVLPNHVIIQEYFNISLLAYIRPKFPKWRRPVYLLCAHAHYRSSFAFDSAAHP